MPLQLAFHLQQPVGHAVEAVLAGHPPRQAAVQLAGGGVVGHDAQRRQLARRIDRPHDQVRQRRVRLQFRPAFAPQELLHAQLVDGLLAQPLRAHLAGIGVAHSVEVDVLACLLPRLLLPVVEAPLRVVALGRVEPLQRAAESVFLVAVGEAGGQRGGDAAHLAGDQRGLEADVQHDERVDGAAHVAI